MIRRKSAGVSLVRFRFDEVVCDEAVYVMQLLQEKPTGWVKRK